MRADVSVYGLLAESREFCKLLYGEKPIQRFEIIKCIHVCLILTFCLNCGPWR